MLYCSKGTGLTQCMELHDDNIVLLRRQAWKEALFHDRRLPSHEDGEPFAEGDKKSRALQYEKASSVSRANSIFGLDALGVVPASAVARAEPGVPGVPGSLSGLHHP